MLAAALMMVSLLSLAWLLVVRTDWTLDRALPVATLGLIGWLYLGYIVGLLHPASHLTLVAPLVLAVVLVRDRQARARVWGTASQTTMLAIIILILAHLEAGRRVRLWDEMRLWGAYPKILATTSGHLQLGPGALLTEAMQFYTPGMPLFLYHLQSLGTFKESMLFLGIGIFCTIFLLPLVKGRLIDEDRLWSPLLLALGASAAMFGPMYFNNAANDMGTRLNSLFIEAPLGVLAGWTCYLLARGATRTLAGCVELGLAGMGLYLLKDAGALAAAMTLIPASVLILVSWRAEGGKRWQRLLAAWGPLSLALGTWTIVKKLHPVHNQFEIDYLHAEGWSKHWPGWWDELTNGSVSAWEQGSWQSHSYMFFTVAMLVVALGVLFLTRHARRVEVLASMLAIIGVNFAQVMGIFALIVGVFNGAHESTQRYLSMPLTATICFAGLLTSTIEFGKIRDLWRTQKVSTVLGALVFVGGLSPLVAQFPNETPPEFHEPWFNEARAWGTQLQQKVQAVEPAATPDKPVGVFVVYADTYLKRVGHSHRMYLDAIGTSTAPGPIYQEIELFHAVDATLPLAERQERTTRQLATTLRAADLHYVYLAESSPRIVAELGPLSPHGVAAGILYRVDFDGDNPQLTPVA